MDTLPTDFTYPNPPNDIPKKAQQQSSPLMGQLKNVWGLPWTKKPLNKAPKGQRGPKTSRSGVHKLGKMKKTSGFY